MISVVIPAYNAGSTLAECVESIVGGDSDGVPHEIIIINDGSTDNTDFECRRLIDKYPQIKYYRKENGGVSSARNLGIEMSLGEYICFVDSDDKVEREYLSTVNDAIEEKPDIVFWGFKKDTKMSGVIAKKIPLPKTIDEDDSELENSIAYLLDNEEVNFFGFTWSKVFKSDIIKRKRIRFDSRLKIKEDEIFTLEYCRHISSLRILNQALYHYNVFEGSLSHSNTKIRYDILADYYEEYANFYNETRLRDVLMDLSISYRLGEIKNLIKNGNQTNEVKALIESKILPSVCRGCGASASRWMPLIKFIPTKQLKSEFIYHMIKR